MERLSPRERVVFEMKHYQGLKLRAIGDALGTTEETVEKFPLPRDPEIA